MAVELNKTNTTISVGLVIVLMFGAMRYGELNKSVEIGTCKDTADTALLNEVIKATKETAELNRTWGDFMREFHAHN